jgi:integration host factor subunit alpha
MFTLNEDMRGFGKFMVKEKESRRGKHPATGETLMSDPRRVMAFKCPGNLRDNMTDNGKGKS